MADITYGAGIKFLIQAESLTSLLARAKDALILADQLEPKIQQLSGIKKDLEAEVARLEENKSAVIAATNDEKAALLAQCKQEIDRQREEFAKSSTEVKNRLANELQRISDKIVAKQVELDTVEASFNERKTQLDATISITEKTLAKAEKKWAELRAMM